MKRHAWGHVAAIAAVALLAGAACERRPGEGGGGGSAGENRESSSPAPRTGTQAGAGAEGSPGAKHPVTQTEGLERAITGQVVRATESELVIRQTGDANVERNAEVRLKVDAGTPVSIAGAQGKVTELKEGTEIRASYRVDGGEPKVTRIEVQHQDLGGPQQQSGMQGQPSQEKGGSQPQAGSEAR